MHLFLCPVMVADFCIDHGFYHGALKPKENSEIQ
jgi:hypothetical protein